MTHPLPPSAINAKPVGMLAQIAAQDLTPVAHALTPTERTLRRGTMLFHDGDELSYAYEIVNGIVKSSKILMDGRRQIIGFLRPGDIVGFPLENRAPFCAEAVTDVTVLCYPISQLEAAMGRSPGLARKLLQLTCLDNEQQQEHVILLGRRRPAERVASFLLNWCADTAAERQEPRTIDLPMSRIDIADYLGLTQETVCRVLSKFKRRGLIQAQHDRKVKINDFRLLENAADEGMLN